MGQQRLTPINGINLDIANDYFPPQVARYIKGLSYQPIDTSEVTESKSGAAGKFKPLISNEVYDTAFALPAGHNQCIGGYHSREENCVIFHNHNLNGNHGVYKINGSTRTIETVYERNCLNYQRTPEHFIHEGGAVLEVLNFIDPNTNFPRKRSFYQFVDGYNDFRYICLEDSIATQGFNPTLFPYFGGTYYDPCLLINAGVPTPDCCLTVSEVTNTTPTLPNNLKYRTWKFYTRHIDVYGRMSNWSDPSDLYVPGGGSDCLASSDALARCLDLTFCAGNPLIDKIDICYTNCDNSIGYKTATLFLYKGSNLGDWWLRPRNPDINYDSVTNTITYRFCDDKECVIVPADELQLTQNGMPRVSQSVAKIGKSVALANNLHGFAPFSEDIMDGITANVLPASAGGGLTRDIEIFVPIYNPQQGFYEPISNLNNQSVFGGYGFHPFGTGPVNGDILPTVGTVWEQHFATAEQRGFIGILAGTGITTVSEQYYLSNGQFIKIDYANANFFELLKAGTVFYQRFFFPSVKPAKYVFRILDHKVSLSDPEKEGTSTYTGGRFRWNNNTRLTDFNAKTSDAKELVVDVCAASYSSLHDNEVLIIYDLAGNDRVIAGYLREKVPAPNEAPKPVELAQVRVPSGTASVRSAYTDHNGFYFVAGLEIQRTIEFWGMCNCSVQRLIGTGVGNLIRFYQQNVHITSGVECPQYVNLPCSRILIKGKVVKCGTQTGVPGVAVALTRGGTAITDADGTFTIVAHDDITNPTRQDTLYYCPTNCPVQGCDDICIDPQQIVIQRCITCAARTLNVADRAVTFKFVRGLLSGGKYGVGIVAYDLLGRHNFVQTKDALYVTMPTIVETRVIGPSTLSLAINPLTVFPDWVKYLRVFITRELGISDYIDWIVDRFELVDNTGQINDVAPTQIKIYYASLLEYNKQNNFNTTTDWGFINTIINNNTGVVESANNYTNDYVEFYMNGDGSFFPSLVRARIKYDKEGQYFLIDYDNQLATLKANALIRLARPNECVTDGEFYGLCAVIPVENGRAAISSIILNAYDTYYPYRTIPVPIPVGNTSENVLRSFGFPFEHHSPSDFWGDHCANFGKGNVKNPYEQEIVFENQVMLSGALSANGQLNYLNYFTNELTKNFNSWNFGGIVAMLVQTSRVLFICQFDTFVAGYDDNLLRATQGGVAVQSGENEFGRPDPKIGANYGCRLFDKNTIRMKDGLVHFVDSNDPGLIQHNFQTAIKVSLNGADGYMRSKIKYIQEWNARLTRSIKYFVGTVDPASNSYLLTDFEIGNTSFGNAAREQNTELSETISFNYFQKVFRGFMQFVPEYYMMLESNTLDVQLFSFANGIPYFHYTTDPNKTYNNFFGVQYESVIRVVAVIDPFLKKKPLAINILCPQTKFFIDQAVTDSNQQTRVLLEHWKKGLYYTSAPLLCDLNTLLDPNSPKQTGVNKLLDGDMLYGSIVDIRFISDTANNGKYFELLGFELYVFEASPTKQTTG